MSNSVKKDTVVRIRIPKPLFERRKNKPGRIESGEPRSKTRREFLKRALFYGGALAASGVFKKWVDRQIEEVEGRAFTPAHPAKKPEFIHLNESVSQVENAIQSILKNPSYNRVALERTAWFHDFIQQHAALNGVDAGLLYALVAQESRGTVTAESRAGACGLAQFIPETGLLYGLNPIEQIISSKGNFIKYRIVGDERFNPDKALYAAARHLCDLIDYYAGREYLPELKRSALEQRGSDPYAVFFALAAYNAGKARVDTAITKTMEEKEIPSWPAVAKRLPKETKNYVPLILAKKIIFENLEHFKSEHALNVSNDAFGAYTQLLKLAEPKQLWKTSIKTFAKRNGFKEEHLQLLNPHFKTNVWLKQAEVLVPKKKELKNFREKFKKFKNLAWNSFSYREKTKKMNARATQAACNHITREQIKKTLAELVPPLPKRLTYRFLRLPRKNRERRA